MAEGTDAAAQAFATEINAPSGASSRPDWQIRSDDGRSRINVQRSGA